jgi:formate-dependent nitrite reductase membrane component NrfD
MPPETLLQRPAGLEEPRQGPSYYDISMLQKPVWTPEVSAYFFLGSLSAGAYVLSRLAGRFGDGQYREVRKMGTLVAAAALAQCPPLLIADLGDPSRFHHMLRVFKPTSPMNRGAWTLTAYGGAVAAAVLREWLDGRDGEDRSLAGRLIDGTLLLVSDAAGVPLALLLAGYTGVLLSGTATPVWSRNHWLGPLFSASAFASGAAAVRLALSLFERGDEAKEALERIQSAGQVAEALALAGFLAAAGSLGRPLEEGRLGNVVRWVTLGGLAVEGLKLLPLPRPERRLVGVVSAALGVVNSYVMRHAILSAGSESAGDPEAARQVSRA